MVSIQVTEKHKKKEGEKLKNKKLLKGNKGFSLVELLIVIAIMGILAVIAFNMFGGVLENSKKRADDQLALEIQNKFLSYCMETNDWKLTKCKADAAGATSVTLIGNSHTSIDNLKKAVFVNGKEYGPYFNQKDPGQAATADVNETAYDPQWTSANGGDYVGWEIVVYPDNQTVTCKPVKAGTNPYVRVAGAATP